jgi:hypothetical protein
LTDGYGLKSFSDLSESGQKFWLMAEWDEDEEEVPPTLDLPPEAAPPSDTLPDESLPPEPVRLSPIIQLESLSRPLRTLIYTTDFDPPPTSQKTSSSVTKQRTIYTRNMSQTMPRLLWLPGEFKLLRGDSDADRECLDSFCANARDFGIMSIMIYAEIFQNYQISLVTLSHPLMTIVIDVKTQLGRGPRLTWPTDLKRLLEDKDMIVVCPGATDWLCNTLAQDHLRMLRDVFLDFPQIPSLCCIQDFEETLHINPSGRDACTHIKMLYWIFQLKIDIQIHGCQRFGPRLSDQWRMLTDHYGKLLIFLYWALCEKQEAFNKFPTDGVNMSPIYLEDLLIRRQIVTDKAEDELRALLIGPHFKYPNPPLPRLPSGKSTGW